MEHDARGGARRKWGHAGAVAARRCSLEGLAGCAPQLQHDGKRSVLWCTKYVLRLRWADVCTRAILLLLVVFGMLVV